SSRDETVQQEGRLQGEIRDAQRLLRNAQQALEEREADGSLDVHRRSFAELDGQFAEHPLTAETLLDEERVFLEARRREADRRRAMIEPLRVELGKQMNRFLREFPDERADLEAAPQ